MNYLVIIIIYYLNRSISVKTFSFFNYLMLKIVLKSYCGTLQLIGFLFELKSILRR